MIGMGISIICLTFFFLRSTHRGGSALEAGLAMVALVFAGSLIHAGLSAILHARL
jgi:hypothetical protein